MIDNSESMENDQQNLRRNFDAFIGGIRETLGAVESYHVGVVTTDEYSANPMECQRIGALVTQTGPHDDRERCGPYAAGANYMTEADDLSEAFKCAADVGAVGDSDEYPMRALRYVVTGSYDGPGDCNEGFFRPDSLFVTVILTDEAAGPEPGDDDPEGPDYWFEKVVESKDGFEDKAVVISLVNRKGSACEPAEPWFDGENIAQFTEMFSYGFVGGICEPDYGPLFQEAIDLVGDACGGFEAPEG